MSDFNQFKLSQITEAILKSNNPDRLKYLWEDYSNEFSKISFRTDLIEGKILALKILTESFNNYLQNYENDLFDKFAFDDLVLSFATVANFIEINVNI